MIFLLLLRVELPLMFLSFMDAAKDPCQDTKSNNIMAYYIPVLSALSSLGF